MKITGVVLAGGKSRRMGQNKSLLRIGDKTIIELIVDRIRPIFDEIILVTNSKDDYKMLKDIRIVPDAYIKEETNSIIGLYTGLLEAKHDYAFVLPCDMPFISRKLIEYMISNAKDYDILVPYINGFYESLHGIYKKTSLEYIKYLYDSENYKIRNLFEKFPGLKIKKIDNSILEKLNVDKECFLNLNTPESYEKALKIFNAKEGNHGKLIK